MIATKTQTSFVDFALVFKYIDTELNFILLILHIESKEALNIQEQKV